MPTIREHIASQNPSIAVKLTGSAVMPAKQSTDVSGVGNFDILRRDPIEWARTVPITVSRLPAQSQMILDAKRWHIDRHNTYCERIVQRHGNDAVLPDYVQAEKPHNLLRAWVRHRYTNYDHIINALEKYAKFNEQAYIIVKQRTLKIVNDRLGLM
jgi:hypothetical protein